MIINVRSIYQLGAQVFEDIGESHLLVYASLDNQRVLQVLIREIRPFKTTDKLVNVVPKYATLDLPGYVSTKSIVVISDDLDSIQNVGIVQISRLVGMAKPGGRNWFVVQGIDDGVLIREIDSVWLNPSKSSKKYLAYDSNGSQFTYDERVLVFNLPDGDEIARK